MATDRKNITLFTVPLKKGEGTNRAPLHALIPEEARSWPEEDFEYYNPLSMPKTIIFVDDRVLCCTLTTELIGLFANWTRTVTPSMGEGEEPIAQQLVREYHSVMSREALERNLTSFRSGECRILVATEAVGMGLDVPDVQRVLQWKVPQFMTVSSWWQRAGRAARDPAVWGLAVIYYEPSLQKPKESPYCGSWDNERELEQIKKLLRPNATVDSEGGSDEGEPGEEEEEEARPFTSTWKKSGKRKTQNCAESREKHLLWYLNSKGCIREVAMDYFDAKPEPRDVQALDSDMRWPQPCCDRCFRADDRHQAYDMWKGFPVRTTTAFQDFDDDGGSSDANEPARDEPKG
jgi:superfamily II DNA/RNA helicase